MSILGNKLAHYRHKIFALITLFTSRCIDYLAYVLNIPVQLESPVFKEEDLIVYICDNNWPRVARMAKYFKAIENIKIVHLCSVNGFNKNFDTYMYDAIALYRNDWHLRRIVRQIRKPRLVQGFAPSSENPVAALKETKTKYVHDMQDVFVSYEGLNTSNREIRHDMRFEKYALQHADGVIGECLEVQEAFRTYHIDPKPKNIYFPLLCDNAYFVKHTKNFNPEDIHIVYAGQVHGSWRNDVPHGPTKFFKLIHILTAQKIHLHLYPNPGIKSVDAEEYVTLAKEHPYFHYHNSVSQEELAKVLTQYDFGILPFFKSMGGPSDTKFKFATTMKLFNYWEGGIPIIVAGDLMYQSWMVERYNTGIILKSENDLNSLRTILGNCDYNAFIKNIEHTRESLSLKSNIHRLQKFYSSL